MKILLLHPISRFKNIKEDREGVGYPTGIAYIGSYLKHKQEVLTDLAKMNKAGLGDNAGEKKFRIREKAQNTEENSEKLPNFLKGKHFNHYSELLAVLEEKDNIKAYE